MNVKCHFGFVKYTVLDLSNFCWGSDDTINVAQKCEITTLFMQSVTE